MDEINFKIKQTLNGITINFNNIRHIEYPFTLTFQKDGRGCSFKFKTEQALNQFMGWEEEE